MIIATDRQWTVPEVLTDYLDDLVASGTRGMGDALLSCRLSVASLGGRPVQQIEFLGERRLVFGFPPVQCSLRVLVAGGRCRLLAGEEKAHG